MGSFPSRMSPNVYEINDYNINVVNEFLGACAMCDLLLTLKMTGVRAEI